MELCLVRLELLLAWVPYAASLWADRLHLRKAAQPWRLLPAAGLWLAFLPNAPYLVTDFMHIRARPDMPWLFWYDIMMMAIFAWTGCILGAVSLGIMQRIVGDYLGRAASWLFVLLTAALCGVGIYLGRFERWNSWDFLLNPRALAHDLIGPLLDPTAYLATAGNVRSVRRIFPYQLSDTLRKTDPARNRRASLIHAATHRIPLSDIPDYFRTPETLQCYRERGSIALFVLKVCKESKGR